MATEYYFGGGIGVVSRALARRLDKLARENGADGFDQEKDTHTFFGPNRGEPENSEMAKRVLAACESAGITFPLPRIDRAARARRRMGR